MNIDVQLVITGLTALFLLWRIPTALFGYKKEVADAIEQFKDCSERELTAVKTTMRDDKTQFETEINTLKTQYNNDVATLVDELRKLTAELQKTNELNRYLYKGVKVLLDIEANKINAPESIKAAKAELDNYTAQRV